MTFSGPDKIIMFFGYDLTPETIGDIGRPVDFAFPEMGLHPKRYADSVADLILARNGEVVIATHSIELLNAVCARVEAKRIRPESIELRILSSSGVLVCGVDERGYALPPWPYGFFLASDSFHGRTPDAENSCNRHDDCAAANAAADAEGRRRPDHCHDECCEECFGA